MGSSFRVPSRIVANASVAIVCVIAALTMIGWATGAIVFAAWRADAVPMAPSTALLALMLGTALLVAPGWRTALAGLAAVGAATLLLDRLRGTYSVIEHLGFGVEGTVGAVPVGFMSPITAGALLVAAVGILLLAAVERGRLSLVVPAALCALLLITGCGLLLLDAFGVPLLIHSTFIPPALNTAVLIVALATALGARTCATRGPVRGTLGEGQVLFLVICLALGVGVAAGAYAYYRYDEQHLREQAEFELDAISRLQAQQLYQWRRERLADGAVLQDNATLSALVERHLAAREDAGLRQTISQWLGGYEAYRDYDAGWIIDRAGVTSLAFLGMVREPSVLVIDAVRPLIAPGVVALIDFYPSLTDAQPRLALVIPVAGAAIVLRIDPRAFLLPLVETWPNASPSGETLLARREGEEVLILSAPRAGSGAPMMTRMPSADSRSIGFHVSGTFTGVVEGLDYHGERALAVIRPVEASTWTIITHLDFNELDAHLWRRLWQVVLVAVLLLVALGAGVAMVWQRQRLRLVLAREVEETRAARLAQLYAAQSACNDAIIRCATEAELCHRVCEVAVSQGGLAMAWVGMVDPATGNIARAASYGQGTAYVDGLNISAHADDIHGQGPTGVAIREGRPTWSDRFGDEPLTQAWREWSRAFGWTASGALPLRRDGQVVGALSVYTTTDSRFDDDSRRLLVEMAANVSFAFDAFDREARRREAEAQLAESAEYYAKLFNEGGLARLLVDPETGRIVEANPAAVALYEWDLSTLTSMRVSEINTAEPESIAEALGRARIGEQTRFEFQHRTASGRLLEVEVWSSSVTVRGRSLLMSTILDVTEQKQLEAQFLQAQKMEVVGRLASGVAHDFNNLLTVINGTAGVAMEELPAGSPLREDFEAILQAGARAAQLTSQLLAFSRRKDWTPVAVDVRSQVTRTADMVRRLMGAGVTLRLELDDALPMVVIDPGQFDQVILNLSVNARDAMPDGGVLTIAARKATVLEGDAASTAGAAPGPHVCLMVRDTGTGMSDETRARLFEPFFTTKEVGRGTGLGLTTVFGIVKHAGGAVTVDTALGRGTTFLVWLPVS